MHLREEAGSVPGTAFALMALARIDAKLGDKAVGLPHLERAKGIPEALGAASRMVWVEQAIAQLLQAT